MISIIVALTSSRVIGRNGEIPWDIPEEKQLFKELTTGHSVVMGRKTFEMCVQKPLPNRQNIVISHEAKEIPGVIVVQSIQEALVEAKKYSPEIFIIGGQEIFEQTLPLADKMYLSHLHQEYEGDTYFPAWNEQEWNKVEEKRYKDFTFAVYERR